jgi:hypothetical protein
VKNAGGRIDVRQPVYLVGNIANLYRLSQVTESRPHVPHVTGL